MTAGGSQSVSSEPPPKKARGGDPPSPERPPDGKMAGRSRVNTTAIAGPRIPLGTPYRRRFPMGPSRTCNTLGPAHEPLREVPERLLRALRLHDARREGG